jgi:hypothetical protein
MKKAEFKNKSFEIEHIKGEILVSYQLIETYHPPTIVEGHGLHKINNNEIEVIIDSVELIINGIGTEIKGLLSTRQLENISENLD